MSCYDHGLFCLSFSAILVVVCFVATPQTFLVSDQLHLSLLIQIPCDCISVRIIARVAFSQSMEEVVVAIITPGFLLLSSVPASVAVRVVWCG